MNKAIRIAKKEMASYFSSPVAFLFLGAFLAINLFFFFWQSQFFARNIADVRPLFEFMPVLLIFLVGALTMRMWSEERRAGTVEFLMTLPVSSFQLVLGKMLACLLLVIISLLLTLPIPITVANLGDLDWGPVWGGYVASIFLAAAYISIGLFVSAKNDNQIVTLIVTVLICLAFYLLGSSLLVPLVGNSGVELLQLLGSGSRFESITRGVLDVRDLYYYVSIMGIFLTLNVYALERLRWEHQTSESSAPTMWRYLTALLALNFLIGNVWLHRVSAARLDLTESQMYSISDASIGYLQQLQEPLLIRGYFSEKTHPLLAPLVPQLRDLLQEYEVVSEGRVRAEFIDPRKNPELEEEANQKYGIKPVPFQISDKYDVSLVNSYFDILILYGDKFEVVNFQDLIDIKVSGESNIDVRLRNPEYDITRSIKKVLYGFQNTESIFESLPKPVVFEGYISGEKELPGELKEYRELLTKVVNNMSELASGKLQVEIKDPGEGGPQLAQELLEKYGFAPMRTLLNPQPFYFSALLRLEDKVVPIPLPQDLTEEAAKRSLEAGLKRFSPGFLKTVGLVTPEAVSPEMAQFNPAMAQNTKNFRIVEEKLGEGYQVQSVDIKDGAVEDDVDLLVVLAPESLGEQERFAVDQFLMKGGTVVLSSSPFKITRSQTELKVEDQTSGLEEWLSKYGISFKKELVLDPQNESYPIPVQRELGGGFRVQEIRKVPYPLFVDIRSDEMNQDSLITSGITQVTLNWSSPILVDTEKTKNFQVTTLFKSSPESWTAKLDSVIPDFETRGPLGFLQKTPNQSVLGVVVEGSFSSSFAGKESPLLKAAEAAADKAPAEGSEEEKKEENPVSAVIEKSPESARIILFASNEFLTDQTIQISASGGTSRYLNSLQLLQNTVDWSLEDRGLLTIRGRGHFSRTLFPLERKEQITWEYTNYAAALFLLLLVFGVYRVLHSQKIAQHKALVESI
ncbi:MAG: Gldg family protein [Bdellovibrionales bacterium]|nr:Gldg family protein [Bdellovibrionales bacterium]